MCPDRNVTHVAGSYRGLQPPSAKNDHRAPKATTGRQNVVSVSSVREPAAARSWPPAKHGGNEARSGARGAASRWSGYALLSGRVMAERAPARSAPGHRSRAGVTSATALGDDGQRSPSGLPGAIRGRCMTVVRRGAVMTLLARAALVQWVGRARRCRIRSEDSDGRRDQ
jgi:hypothetical protein